MHRPMQDPSSGLYSFKRTIVWRWSLMSLWFLQTQEVKMISEFWHLLLTLSPECDKRHNMAVVQPCVWATGLFTFKVPSSKCCSGRNVTTSGCGKLFSLRHPLETAARRRKAPFWQVRKQPPVLSTGHSKVGQGREHNVDGRCQRHLRTPASPTSAFC